MKYTSAILLTVLMMAGCGQREAGDEGIISLDVVDAPLQKKELILQDFMDVEYIVLNSYNFRHILCIYPIFRIK